MRVWHKVTYYVLTQPEAATIVAARLDHDARTAASELGAAIDAFTLSPLHPEAAAIVEERAGGDS